MTMLDAAQIQLLLTGSIFQAVFCFPEVNSTNTQLLLAARYGEPEGTVYVADRQSAGRGRFRRPWVAPPGKALLFSFLLYPKAPEEHLGLLPMTVALAATEAIREILGNTQNEGRVTIKWPNDVLIDRRKVGGVLAEREMVQGGQRTAVIVGMGLNINQTAEELPERPVLPATSLMIEAERTFDRGEVLAAVLRRFSDHYQSLFRRNVESLINKICVNMTTIGQPVAMTQNGMKIEGTAAGLSQRGGLIVRLPSGVEREFMSSDVESLDWHE